MHVTAQAGFESCAGRALRSPDRPPSLNQLILGDWQNHSYPTHSPLDQPRTPNVLTPLGSTSRFPVPVPVSSRLVATLCCVTAVVLVCSHIYIHALAFVRAPSSAERRPRKHGAHSDRCEPKKIRADKNASLLLRTDPYP